MPNTRPRRRRTRGAQRIVESAARIGHEMLVIADDAAPQRQHQPDGVIGHLARPVIGRVADRDARFGRGVEIDMVETHAGPHDDPAALQRADECTVDLHLMPDHDRVAGRQRRRRQTLGAFARAECPNRHRRRRSGVRSRRRRHIARRA